MKTLCAACLVTSVDNEGDECMSCADYLAYYAAMTPEQRAAEDQMIAYYVQGAQL